MTFSPFTPMLKSAYTLTCKNIKFVYISRSTTVRNVIFFCWTPLVKCRKKVFVGDIVKFLHFAIFNILVNMEMANFFKFCRIEKNHTPFESPERVDQKSQSYQLSISYSFQVTSIRSLKKDLILTAIPKFKFYSFASFSGSYDVILWNYYFI